MRYLILFPVLALAACAPGYSTTANSWASQYDTYNCRQLQAELQLTQRQYHDRMNAMQQKQIFNAAVSIVDPSRSPGNTINDDRDLKELKDREAALEHMQIRKDCPVPQQQ